MEEPVVTVVSPPTAPSPKFNSLLLYFLKLGTFGFGGPIALVGYMQRDLVDQRKWMAKEDYVEGLAFSQLSPGPLAAQLAMYLGWVRAGFVGALFTGLAFILPSFFMVLALAALYIRYGGLSWIEGAFYGISAAVIAVIARSAYKLTKLTLGKDILLWLIFAGSTAFTAITRSENILLFLGSGLLVLVIRSFSRRAPTATLVMAPWLITGLYGPAEHGTYWRILVFFTEAGAFVFGSGLAIVPFLHEGVVERFKWLTERQFLDSVAVAMITPGPVVITSGFIGYLVAGPLGACLAAAGVFIPPFLFVVILAPYYRKFGTNPKVKAFIAGVTAAATGAIAGATIILGRQAIKDVGSAVIGTLAFLLLLWTKKVPEPVLILIAALIGVFLARI
jgi:chromate transporter